MAQTKTQLGESALRMMRQVEGDANPESYATTIIEAGYDQVYQMLRTRHLVSWGPTDSIPDECVNPVMALTAKSRLSFFKVPADSRQEVLSAASTAIGDLTAVLGIDYVSQQIPSEPL